MIKTYSDLAALTAAGLPIDESRVALIEEGNVTQIDGVNVIKKTPRLGDAIYTESNGAVHIVDRDTLNKNLIPDGWTYKGPFLKYLPDMKTMAVFNGNFDSLPTKKWADVVQFSISAISASSIKFWLKMKGDYDTFVPIEVTLTSATINATSASEISTAIEATGNTGNVGYANHGYWAYLADANGNKVDSDGTQIIVQCDFLESTKQHVCSDTTHALVGCTMTFSTWGDMPASSTYLKFNGKADNQYGLMNIEGGALYWSTNGRTLDANATVGGETGKPMKKADYLSSQYATAIRAAYATYEDYLRGEYGIMEPQKYGCFLLPDGKTMTDTYGSMTAPTKGGSTKAKFPALNWAYELGSNNHLWDVEEGVLIMKDENLAIINATQTKAGKVTISTAAGRWFAERYGASSAWVFGGGTRSLNNVSVNYASQVGAVTLLMN